MSFLQIERTLKRIAQVSCCCVFRYSNVRLIFNFQARHSLYEFTTRASRHPLKSRSHLLGKNYLVDFAVRVCFRCSRNTCITSQRPQGWVASQIDRLIRLTLCRSMIGIHTTPSSGPLHRKKGRHQGFNVNVSSRPFRNASQRRTAVAI